MNIKCPNCGSTAQVVFTDEGSHYSTTTQKEYTCGCGCIFEVVFEAVKVNILRTEN